jgi:hypothetical protein
MKIRFYDIIWLLVILVLMVIIGRCNHVTEIVNLEGKLALAEKENQKFKAENDAMGNRIYTQNAIIVGLTKDIQNYSKIKLGISKPRIITDVRWETKVESVLVPYEKQIYIRVGDTDAVVLPAKLSLSDSDLFFSGRLLKSGMMIDSLKMDCSLTFGVGDRREKWYKPKETVVRIKTDNKYVQIKGMNNIVVKPKRSWYERPIVTAGAGFLLGGYLTLQALK